MIYRVEHRKGKSYFTFVEAESVEEAIKKTERRELLQEWIEDYGGQEFLEKVIIEECYDGNEEPATSVEDIEDEDNEVVLSANKYYDIAESK